MKCEICDIEPATMWVQNQNAWGTIPPIWQSRPIPSCDDCGPRLGYAILAPVTSSR